MAETNTTRLGLRQWSSDNDTVNRPEFNNSFASLEQLVAIDKQGLTTARPAPGVVGTYYFATDTNIMWRDNGTKWIVVGSKVKDLIVEPTNTISTAVNVNAQSGQSADLVRINDSTGAVLSRFDKNGAFKSGGVYITNDKGTEDQSRLYGSALSVIPLASDIPGQVTRGRVNQSANLHEFRTSNGVIGTRINNVGHIVTQRAQKVEDTNATSDSEFVTYGQVSRMAPKYTFTVMSLSQYNALLIKDSKTLYVIVGQ